jgi:hypothetical protein
VSKFFKLLLVIGFLIACGSFLLKKSLNNDPDRSLIDSYIRGSEDIKERFGGVQEITVMGRTSVSAGNTSPAYKIFRVKIKGPDSSDVLNFVVQDSHDGGRIVHLGRLPLKPPSD